MTMNIKPAEGKLGVLCVGLGAVSTTLITGTLMARKGLANPVGSFTQIGKMRVGRGDKKQYKHVGEIVPLTNLNDIVFGAWDVFTDNAYESALYCQVLKREDIALVRDELERIKPMKACFDPEYAKNLVEEPAQGYPKLQEGERLRPSNRLLDCQHREIYPAQREGSRKLKWL